MNADETASTGSEMPGGPATRGRTVTIVWLALIAATVVGWLVSGHDGAGADPVRIRAAIGPTISGPNYEVGDQFRADLLAITPDGASFFTTPAGGKPHFDLPGFVQAQLRAAGIGPVEDLGICTYAAPERYFSHRYATHQQTKTGRQIAVIAMT